MPPAADTYWTRDDQGQPAKPRMIPRMNDWINRNCPGTKIALAEYDFGAHASIVGGLAEARIWGTPWAPEDSGPVRK